VFDHPVFQRCQLHKIRNVEAKLPKTLAATVAKKMRAAYHDPDPLPAGATLEALVRSLDKNHPGAAGSLREGLAETLTIGRLGVAPILARTLRSTNAIESMIEICRDHSSNVKRWRDGQMALRWCAAGMGEAAKQLRRVNGHLHLPAPRTALDNHTSVTATEYKQGASSLTITKTATQVPRNSRHPPAPGLPRPPVSPRAYEQGKGTRSPQQRPVL